MYGFVKNHNTVRPRGKRPHGTRTSLGHNFKKGSKNFEISDFGTQTSLGRDFKNAKETKRAKLFDCQFDNFAAS